MLICRSGVVLIPCAYEKQLVGPLSLMRKETAICEWP